MPRKTPLEAECTAENCDKTQHSSGLCNTHYSAQWRRTHPIMARERWKAQAARKNKAKKTEEARKQRQAKATPKPVREEVLAKRRAAKQIAVARSKYKTDNVVKPLTELPEHRLTEPTPAPREVSEEQKAYQFRVHSADRDEAIERRRELRAQLREQANGL